MHYAISPEVVTNASFKSSSWLREDCRTLDTKVFPLAKAPVADVELSLELIVRSEMDTEATDEVSPPFLNAAHVNILQRFAITSCDPLDGVSKLRFEHLTVQPIRKERK